MNNDLRELILTFYYSNITDAARDLCNAEWVEIEEFDEISNDLSSELAVAISENDNFTEYSFDEIFNEVDDLICTEFHERIDR